MAGTGCVDHLQYVLPELAALGQKVGVYHIKKTSFGLFFPSYKVT